MFYLTNRIDPPFTTDVAFAFGPAGSAIWPIAGDWDGNGVDTVGVHDRTTTAFYFTNVDASNPAPKTLAHSYVYGVAGDVEIAADWDDDGYAAIGVYRPATAAFYLREDYNSNDSPVALTFGNPYWQPMAGAWHGESG